MMMRVPCILTFLVGLFAAPVVFAMGPELVPNGGFEKGKDGAPLYWTPPDNLTIFWERGGRPGRCIHCDTDVYRSEWEKNKANPGSVKTKTITSGRKYNTVGGSVGVAVYSWPIPVESAAWYLVRYDVKGPGGEPFLYMKGYVKVDEAEARRHGSVLYFHPKPGGPAFTLVAKGGVGEGRRPLRPGDYLQVFRRRFVTRFDPKAKNKWHRVAGVVHLKKRYGVECVLLELYAYWPPGDYYFDNVSMRRISEAEAQRFLKERKKYATPLH